MRYRSINISLVFFICALVSSYATFFYNNPEIIYLTMATATIIFSVLFWMDSIGESYSENLFSDEVRV